MSRKHDQPARRRATAPTLATLEDRRLMTRGLMPTSAAVPPIPPTGVPPIAALATADARLASVASGASGASTSSLPAFDPTSTKDWIYQGSDAQFGPSTSYVVLGGGNAWPAPATTPATSADASTPQRKLDAAFAKQSADIQAIQDKSEVTPKLLATLRQAREKVAAEAGTADASLVKTLQDDTAAVQQTGSFTDAQQAQIQADFTAALKGAGVSDASIAELFAAQDAVRAASGVTAADLQTLADDQAAVQAALDAMPKDGAIPYAAEAASSARGGAVTTADKPLTTSTMPAKTTVATPTPAVSAANAAAVGTLPTGVKTPTGDVPSAIAATTNPVKPLGFDSSVQLARLSRRTATASSGRLQGAANATRALAGRGVAASQAVPAAARRLAAFRGMRPKAQG